MDITKRGASESPEEHQRKVGKKDESNSESTEKSKSPSGLTTSPEQILRGNESPSGLTTTSKAASDNESKASTHHTLPVSTLTSQSGQSTSSAKPLPASSAQPLAAQSSQSTSATPASQVTTRVQTTRDTYLITREVLGMGTYGVVLKAQRVSDQRDVAVKMMKVSMSSQISVDYEENLVIYLMAYQHRNIVQYYDTFKQTLGTMLFSELSTVGDIFKAMQITNDEGNKIWIQFDENLSRHLIVGIARDAYQTAADPRGMVTAIDRRTPKLTDFSSSPRGNTDRPADPIIRVRPLCALPFAAPESYKMIPYDCIIADLFSLGCCLISMIMGAIPFVARIDPIDNQNLTAAIKAQNQERKRKFINKLKTSTTYKQNICKICSKPLKHLLEGLLEANPQNRITLDQFFAHEWVTRPKSREFEDVSGKVSLLTTHPLIDGIQFVTYAQY